MSRLIGFLALILPLTAGSAVFNHAEATAPRCGQAPVEKLLGAPAPPGASTYCIVPKRDGRADLPNGRATMDTAARSR